VLILLYAGSSTEMSSFVPEIVKMIGDKNNAHYGFKMLVNYYEGVSWFIRKRYKQV
jgi:hypothetical protein